jgi:purine nucleosidase
MPRPFLIDTDTASDDAVALIMAFRHPDVDVRAVTTVAGNVPVEQATRNALYTAELCNRTDVPVHPGLPAPLVRPYEHAQWFHGRDGLGDMNYPAPARPPEPEPAVDAILRIATTTPNLTIVTLGPLTNLAAALSKNPSLTSNVSRLVVMGGNPCCEGNVTPAAEYNIWVDPEAAQSVFRADWPSPPEMAGWHLCRGDAVISPSEMSHLRTLGPLGRFCVDCNRVATQAILTQTGEHGISLPDPTAMAIAIDPTLATHASTHLTQISLDAHLTRGQTLVDRLNVATDPRNAPHWSHARPSKIIWTLNTRRFKHLLFHSLQL